MELILLIGLQASGKSTFYRTYFSQSHTLVSKDLMPNHRRKGQRQAFLIHAALQERKSVVVDNTNPTLEDRAALIELGNIYQTEQIGYYFRSTVPASLARNQTRLGKARVPDVAIYATAKKLVVPSYAEGFDQLFAVEIQENNQFKVTALLDQKIKIPRSNCD